MQFSETERQILTKVAHNLYSVLSDVASIDQHATLVDAVCTSLDEPGESSASQALIWLGDKPAIRYFFL